ncbi:MAG: hypothetical protein GX893_07855 [Firmicutes bacterium]|nr:hypothetical protein [Bacillota bacterium]
MKKIVALICLAAVFFVGFGSFVINETDDRFQIEEDLPLQVASQMKNYITYEQIPQDLINAVISVEDQRFFSHAGVDFIGLGRAILVNIKSGRFVQGGSTITQQLAKNLFLSQEQTITRKIKELFLTLALERNYSKEEILEMYLNYSYFGAGAYGIAEASEKFFQKDVSQLTVEECALLAGVLKGPSIYNPIISLEKAQERQAIVLSLMRENGYLE